MKPDKLLNASECAEFLGVSVSTLRRMYQKEGLPYLKVRRQIRFDPDDVKAHLRRQNLPPTP